MQRIAKLTLLVTALALSASLVAAQEATEEAPDSATITIDDTEFLIQSLDFVTESAPQALDITATTARVNFIGTEPLACYLVYGTDETFGGVTNDPDMAQAAIIEHNPILVDLAPDTTYFYRMQGVGEDGVMYVSPVYQFTTLPESDEPNNNLLALENGATITAVSSNFGDQPDDGRWGILNALDDNPATAWSSNGDGDDAFFEVALPDIMQISEISYTSRSMTDGTAITESFTVTTDSGDVYGPFEIASPNDPQTFDVDITASSLRFDIEASTGGNVGAVDVSAVGAPVE